MAIQKRFIHFKKFSDFNSKKLSANEANTQYTVGVSGAIQNGEPDILYQSYVWIKDTKQQWTHAQLYGNDSTVDLTYEELKSLRDSAQLIPGQQYRITDYMTTTTQAGTASAGHQFDIIVTSKSENELFEYAKADYHEGDTYFLNSNLSAWELKYTLDNNTSKYAWADATNGKGVIYYMKDEWNNECPYDFKNILISSYIFEKENQRVSVHTYLDNTSNHIKSYDYKLPQYCYTFCHYKQNSLNGNLYDVGDYSINHFIGRCMNNVIREYKQHSVQYINKLVLAQKVGMNHDGFYNNDFSSSSNSIINVTWSTGSYNNNIKLEKSYIGVIQNSQGSIYNSYISDVYDDIDISCNDVYADTISNCRITLTKAEVSALGNCNGSVSRLYGSQFTNCSFNNCSKIYICEGFNHNIQVDNTYGETLERVVYEVNRLLSLECVKFGSYIRDLVLLGNKYLYYYNYPCIIDNNVRSTEQITLLDSMSDTGTYTAYIPKQIHVSTYKDEGRYYSDKQRTLHVPTYYISQSTSGDIIMTTVDDVINNVNTISTTYEELVNLRDTTKLIPGCAYRITDYQTIIDDVNATSALHQFDVIVTALDKQTLSEEARAIQHNRDTYFAKSELNTWKVWYSLDNDKSRFDWASVGEVTGVDDAKFTAFYWNDPTSGEEYNAGSNRDDLICDYDIEYDDILEKDNTVIYKTKISYYLSEGADYQDKWFYRGEITVDGNTYDSWQKWDADWNGFYNKDGNALFALTGRIVNQDGSVNLPEISIKESSKGVIYRMIDEFGNDCPYDFKNIKFKRPDTKKDTNFYYTFSEDSNGNVDKSLWKGTCFNNKIEAFGYMYASQTSTTSALELPHNIFIGKNNVSHYIANNVLDGRCQNNVFGYGCHNNKLENVSDVTFGDSCVSNSLKYCFNITLPNGSHHNTFEECRYIKPLPGITPKEILHSTFENCEHVDIDDYIEFCSFSDIDRLKNMHNPLKSCIFKNSEYASFSFDCSILDDIILFQDPIGGVVVEQYYTYHNDGTEICTSISLSNSDIMNVTYDGLKKLMSKSYLKPGYKYRIVDYVTTTSQKDTMSAGHKFDIIVTANSPSTLSEEAKVCPNEDETYFDDVNLNAWEIKYCIDNDTNRFAWAGDERIETTTVETIVADSSECTIKPELIDGNAFITPFNFESCVWVDGNSDGDTYDDGGSNHDAAELVYEWGYFTDDNDNTHLCLYKSNADLYEEEGQPDYGDKYLYRGIVDVDGINYDYWQKWDISTESTDINGSGDYVFATTPRIVSNPEAYSSETITETIETVIPLEPKGVIYYMKDEHGNEAPYDFKNIQFKRCKVTSDLEGADLTPLAQAYVGYPLSGRGASMPLHISLVDESDYKYVYTFSCVNNGSIVDASLGASGIACYDNSMKLYIANNVQYLNDIVMYAHPESGNHCITKNTFASDCFSMTLGCEQVGEVWDNHFGQYCKNNIIMGPYVYQTDFGANLTACYFSQQVSQNSIGSYMQRNFVNNTFVQNVLGPNCKDNIFMKKCSLNTIGEQFMNNTCNDEFYQNNLGAGFLENTFNGKFNSNVSYNQFMRNTINGQCSCCDFGTQCTGNTLGIFRNSKVGSLFMSNVMCDTMACVFGIGFNCNNVTATKMQCSTFGTYVMYNNWTSSGNVKNIKVSDYLQGTTSSYNNIELPADSVCEVKVAKNSSGDIKIYCEADLIS